MLHQEVERLKVSLSSETNATLNFKSYPIEINFGVESKNYNQIIENSVNEIAEAALQTVNLGDCEPRLVDVLQFTGGTAKVPAIRSKISSLFPNAKIVNAEAFTAVAEGLAKIKGNSFHE